MKKILLGLLTCLLSASSLPAESIFAYLYNDNAKSSVHVTKFGFTSGYLTQSPVHFNSKTTQSIAYDSKTGELMIPEKGHYEVVYSIIPNDQGIQYMSLAVNGKEKLDSRVTVTTPFNNILNTNYEEVRPVTTSTYIVKLKKGDRLSLILPYLPKNATLYFNSNSNRYDPAGHSASLLVKKL